MSLQQDDLLIISPSVSIIKENNYVKMKNKNQIIKLNISDIVIDSLLNNGLTVQELKNLLIKDNFKAETISTFIDFMIKNHFLSKKDGLEYVKNFNYISSYNSLEKGVYLTSSSYDKEEYKKSNLSKPIKTNIIDIISKRKSNRKFKFKELSNAEFSTILFAMYGQLENDHRVVSSAGNSYGINILVLIYNVEGLEKGIYKYNPISRVLNHVDNLSRHDECFITKHIDFENATFSIVLGYNIDYICKRYAERGYNYALIESGLILQNAQLVSLEFNLGSTIIGGINDEYGSPLKKYFNEENNFLLVGMVFGYV